MLRKLEIPDPNEINKSKRIDDLTKWPEVTNGNIFAFILKNKEFSVGYIGKYKDQKAYSYFDGGFVGPVLFYEPKSKQKSGAVFFYCSVTASKRH